MIFLYKKVRKMLCLLMPPNGRTRLIPLFVVHVKFGQEGARAKARMLRTPTVSVPEKPTRVLTGAQLWGNASAIAAHGRWVRGFTNASVIIGVQKSGTTALGARPAQLSRSNTPFS